METVMVDDINRITSVHFDSMHDLLEFKPTECNRTTFGSRIDSNTKGTSWYGPGNHSSHDVIKHAYEGWLEGYAELSNMLNKLDATGHAKEEMAKISKRRRKRYKSNQGYEVDIHAINQGRLDRAWTNIRRQVVDARHKLITVMIDVGGTAGEDVFASLWRAAVAVKLTDALISAGKSVRIVVGSYAVGVYDSHPGYRTTTSIVVKQYNEPLSLERLAGMAHLGFHRVFNFKARAAHYWKCSYGYGASTNGLDKKENIPLQFRQDLEEGYTEYVYLSRSRNMASAQQSMKSALQQLHMGDDNAHS